MLDEMTSILLYRALTDTRYNHNHGPDGKFTSGSGTAAGVDNSGESSIINNIKPGLVIPMQYFARKRRTVEPAPEDRSHLRSQINTLYHSRYEGKKVGYHYSANYKYKIRINGFNDYVLLSKKKLK